MRNWKEIKKWTSISLIISSICALISAIVFVVFVAFLIMILTKNSNILEPWWKFALCAAASLIISISILLLYIAPMHTIKKSARKNTINKVEIKAITYYSRRLKFVSFIYNFKIKKLLTDSFFNEKLDN